MRRLRGPLVAGCLLASSVVWLAGGAAGSHEGLGVPASALGSGATLRALQFNLCDSGIAGCFTGRSVGVAAAVIRYERPDVVTLNEVCHNDVSVLARAMSAGDGGRPVRSAFVAAVDRRTGGPFRCLNGQQYGIGLLAPLRSPTGDYRTYDGVYPSQDLDDPEERVWLCAEVRAGFLACTTHTASTSRAVALAQCRFFFRTALLGTGVRPSTPRVMLGADLNLPADGSSGAQACLPAGYRRVDDGSVQDVVTSRSIAIRSRTTIDMGAATDHPGLLVELTLR